MSSQWMIVSGGQTGVDRAALDAALDNGVSCGGWCPEGRIAEDGILDQRYPLQELAGAGYRQRTRQNIIDSDATLIVYFNRIRLRSGTELTLHTCIKKHKPYLLIDGEACTAAYAGERIARFVSECGIGKLNVGGPSGSKCPQAYTYTYDALCAAIAAWRKRINQL